MNGKMTCENCKEEFNPAMASCGTGYTYHVFKCPHCKHDHVVERGFNPIDMLAKEQK